LNGNLGALTEIDLTGSPAAAAIQNFSQRPTVAAGTKHGEWI
jgi:hypothetical protein